MNALFIFPVIFQLWKELKALRGNQNRRQKQKCALAVAAFVFQISGICGILYLVSRLQKHI